MDGYARRKAEFRARILDAAVELLREKGVDFTTRALAARANVSEATPFNHFGSKQGVFRALVDRTLDELAVRLAATRAPRDPLLRVFTYGALITDVYAADPDVYRPIFGDLFRTADEQSERLVFESIALWQAQLEYARERGALQPGRDLRVVATQLEVDWLGALNLWVARAYEREAWLDRVEYGIAVMLSGLVVDELQPKLKRRIARLEKRIAARLGHNDAATLGSTSGS